MVKIAILMAMAGLNYTLATLKTNKFKIFNLGIAVFITFILLAKGLMLFAP